MTLRPPSGTRPPASAEIGGRIVDLAELAKEICARYRAEFGDEHERYGDAGIAWCRHDNQWLLAWAAGDVRGGIDLDAQVNWLARVLHARDFPVNRLVRDLEIAAGLVLEAMPGEAGAAIAGRLAAAAESVAALDLGPDVPD